MNVAKAISNAVNVAKAVYYLAIFLFATVDTISNAIIDKGLISRDEFDAAFNKSLISWLPDGTSVTQFNQDLKSTLNNLKKSEE